MTGTTADVPDDLARHAQRCRHLRDVHGVRIPGEVDADAALLGAVAAYHAGRHDPRLPWDEIGHMHEPAELDEDLASSVLAYLAGVRRGLLPGWST